MRVVGIDPGLSGAISIVTRLYPFFEVDVIDMPTIKGKTRGRDLHTTELLDICLHHYDLDLIVIEKPVLARPGEGRGSIGKFGYTTGLTEGIYRGVHHDTKLVLVSPQKWKGHFNLLGQDKNSSREWVMDFFKDEKDLFKRKKDDGRAEATLIALYGIDHFLATNPQGE
jgi:crossover junction endodeoxyribonuclease RuvC